MGKPLDLPLAQAAPREDGTPATVLEALKADLDSVYKQWLDSLRRLYARAGSASA